MSDSITIFTKHKTNVLDPTNQRTKAKDHCELAAKHKVQYWQDGRRKYHVKVSAEQLGGWWLVLGGM